MTAETAAAPVHVRRRRGKVLYQLLALLLAVGVGPLVISSRKMMEINQSTLESGILNFHTQLVTSTTENVETFLRQVRETLQGMARFQGMVELLNDTQRQDILIHYLDSYNYLQSLKVLDHEGKEKIEVSQTGAAALWSQVEQAEAKQALRVAAAGEVYSGLPFATAGVSSSFMDFTVPIRDEEGRVIGALMALVSLADLQSLVSRIRVGNTGQAYVVDRRGVVVAHRDLELVRDRENLSDLEIVGNYLLTGQTVGTVPFHDRRGREMLGAYALIKEAGWGVVIEERRDEAYHSLQEMRRQTVFWVSLGVLLAIGLGVVFAQRISDPIRKFAQKSLAIANGDFKGRIDLKARSEIGQLAETFNYMTEQLDLYDKNMRELFLSTIKSLAAAIDAKDPYTRGHSERVTIFSLAIARELDFNDKELERVQIAALLHDVGKIGIDDRILRKPDKLTEEEYDLIKTHPALGASIMAPIKQLKDIIPGMRHHHERLDGKGYPLGLAGGEIPLIARIIAVADTFDAMTSDRLYQKARDDEFVIKTLIQLAGTQYEPKAVQAFVIAHPKLARRRASVAAVQTG